MERSQRVVATLTGVAIILAVSGLTVAVLDPGLSNGTGSAAIPTSRNTSSAAPTSNRPDPGTPSSMPSGATSPASPVVSASPSAELTQSLRGFIQIGDALDWYGDDGTVVPVANVPGLTVRIESGRAIYYALAGNPYGLAIGSYAGEFMPGVTMGQIDGSNAQAGGIVLTGPVVNRLILDALAAITDDSSRWIVALPVDIRDEKTTPVSVSFDSYGLGSLSAPRVLVRFDGSLPLVETVPTNAGYHILVEGLGVTAWQVMDPARLRLPTDQLDPAHLMNELLFYGDGAVSASRNVAYDAHVEVGTQLMAITGDVSVSLAVTGYRADIGPSNVLTVGNSPVFVAAS